MQLDITTAVDSLVELIHKKKRITIEAAAKQLGLPSHIVNEWANFLEDDKILKIEYKFTTPYLIASKKTKEAAEAASSELESQKDILTRKVEIMLSRVQKHSLPHEKNIKTAKDVKALLKKKTFQKGKLTPDFVYAQQVVLESKLNSLIKKISKMNNATKSLMTDQAEKLSQWKEIFEDNVKKVK